MSATAPVVAARQPCHVTVVRDRPPFRKVCNYARIAASQGGPRWIRARTLRVVAPATGSSSWPLPSSRPRRWSVRGFASAQRPAPSPTQSPLSSVVPGILADPPVVLFIGDSYGAGWTSRGSARWSSVVAASNGWVELNFARAGSGYAAIPGPPVVCGFSSCPAFPEMAARAVLEASRHRHRLRRSERHRCRLVEFRRCRRRHRGHVRRPAGRAPRHEDRRHRSQADLGDHCSSLAIEDSIRRPQPSVTSCS